MKVVLAYSPAAGQVQEWVLELAAGSTLAQALERARSLDAFAALAPDAMPVGIWGKRVGLQHLLQENDRIEIYRSLRVDPKVARRERFNKQGIKRAGLFAAARPGAKSGY